MNAFKTKSNSGPIYRKMYIIFLTLGLFLISPQIFAQTKSESEILVLSKEKFRWQNEGKLDLIANLLDRNAVIVQPDGSIQSKDEYLKYLRSEKAFHKNVEVKGAIVRINGSTATLVGKAKIEYFNLDNEYSDALSFTEVYAFENNAWKLVAQHSTSIIN